LADVRRDDEGDPNDLEEALLSQKRFDAIVACLVGDFNALTESGIARAVRTRYLTKEKGKASGDQGGSASDDDPSNRTPVG